MKWLINYQSSLISSRDYTKTKLATIKKLSQKHHLTKTVGRLAINLHYYHRYSGIQANLSISNILCSAGLQAGWYAIPALVWPDVNHTATAPKNTTPVFRSRCGLPRS